jgi:hypothetical protein
MTRLPSGPVQCDGLTHTVLQDGEILSAMCPGAMIHADYVGPWSSQAAAMNMRLRASGRSTRQVMRAFDEVLAGRRIILFAATYQQAKYALQEPLRREMIRHGLTTFDPRRIVLASTSGPTPEEVFRGRLGAAGWRVFFDHTSNITTAIRRAMAADPDLIAWAEPPAADPIPTWWHAKATHNEERSARCWRCRAVAAFAPPRPRDPETEEIERQARAAVAVAAMTPLEGVWAFIEEMRRRNA